MSFRDNSPTRSTTGLNFSRAIRSPTILGAASRLLRQLSLPRLLVSLSLALTCALGLSGKTLAQSPEQQAAGQPPVDGVSDTAQGQRYVDLVFDSVERDNDIVFGTATDKPSGREVELKLDVYEPAGDELQKRPVFVFFFGGGFVAGDRKREPQFYCNLMARRGYVAIAPDYRLNQGNLATEGIPAAVSDARQALAWIEAEAESRGFDKDRVIIGGSSAGAITSLFATYTELEPDPDTSAVDPALVLDLWGGLYTYVNDMETGEAPLAIFHGTNDNVVPFSEAEALRDRAEDVDIRYLFSPLVGEGHAPFMPESILALFAGFAFDVLDLGAEPTEVPPTATSEPSPEPSPTPALPTATLEPIPSPTATSTEPAESASIFMPSLWMNQRR